MQYLDIVLKMINEKEIDVIHVKKRSKPIQRKQVRVNKFSTDIFTTMKKRDNKYNDKMCQQMNKIN